MMHSMNERQMRELAETIADDLFINGCAEEANRLVLTKDKPVERNLGGWSRRAVVERVVKALREYRA